MMSQFTIIKKNVTELASNSNLSNIGIPSHLRQGYSILEETLPQDEFMSMEEHVVDTRSFYRRSPVNAPGPHPCSICCGIFSAIGVVFLLIIGCIVSSNSLYINVKPEEGESKASLAWSVFAGAFLYGGTLGLSTMYYLRGRRAAWVYDQSQQMHANREEEHPPEEQHQHMRPIII